MSRYARRKARRGAGRRPKRRLGLVAVAALFAVASYYYGMHRQPRPSEAPPVRLSVDQEIALGRLAAPRLIQQYGGLHPDRHAEAFLNRICRRLAAHVGPTPYRFEVHLLADGQTADAFALPGGPLLVTAGLTARLRTEGELAGVLAHLMGHVVERHTAAHLAGGALPPASPAAAKSVADEAVPPAALVARATAVSFGLDDERAANARAVRWMAEAGYDPRALLGVMEALEAAAEGRRRPAFFRTHPHPGRRVEQIEAALGEQFPNGVPGGLVK